MNVVAKCICCCVMNCVIVWISGCTGKFSNVPVSNLNYIENQLYCRSKLLQRKDISSNINISSNSLDKEHTIVNRHHTYNDFNKGSYSSYFYQVQPGDTLFYISWITGNDCHVLAKKNNIDINDILKVGQILQVNNDRKNLNSKIFKNSLRNNISGNIKKISLFHLNTSKLGNFFSSKINNNIYVNEHNILNKNFVNLSNPSKNSRKKSDNERKSSFGVLSNEEKIVSNMCFSTKNESSISWGWPAVGKIISNFSSSEGGNKGIDISGKSGQPVFAASYGKVVYAGNALFGYGNLIIIKHANNFLSTYAHNDKILVIEQQNVALGQKIATMGNSGSDMVKLRFEIRYKGKSVDPLSYLPRK